MPAISLFDVHRRRGDFVEMDIRDKAAEINNLLHFKDLGGNAYKPRSIENAAVYILKNGDFYPERNAIPIVKVAERYNIKVYQTGLDREFPGNILINGSTKERFGHDRVILASKDAEFYTQRFIVAHELAHYLFDYPNDDSFGTNELFSDNYFKDNHNTVPEQRANRFAAAILMPRDLFLKQYRIAVNHNSKMMFILTYLSQFFEVPFDSVSRRIEEVAEFEYA